MNNTTYQNQPNQSVIANQKLSQIGYRTTGNASAVSRQELVQFVHQKLNEYIEIMNATQSKPEYNPFVKPIIYVTKDGKETMIPEEIQRDAVESWSSINSGVNLNQPNEMPGMPDIGLGSPIGSGLSGASGADVDATVGAPLQQTSHMGQIGNQMEGQIQFLENSQIQHQHQQQLAQSQQMQQQMQTQQMQNQQMQQFGQNHLQTQMEEQLQQQQLQLQDNDSRDSSRRVLVVERDNSVLYYTIILLLLVIGGYYYYSTKN